MRAMRNALLALGATLLAMPAMAQTVAPQVAPARTCGSYEELSAQLKDQYQEEETSLGQSSEGLAIVLFTAPEGKTWSILSVSTSGMACFLGMGTDWSQGDLPTGGQPA